MEDIEVQVLQSDERQGWRPPSSNSFKVNVDGAVFSNQKATGVGVTIRDDRVRLEAAMSKKLHAPLGALKAEAKAFKAGIIFARDVGVQDIIIEGDSMIIFRALCELSPPPQSVASIIEGILDIVREFRSVQFSHTRRQGNIPAHILAKHASSIANFTVWIEQNPCFIEQALIHDVISLPSHE
ncbi:uncharacterized protein LOC142609068 [Castanea sativa]|uniref:uncharacterized protein LOC142609068 n=1 Tax=Castanea sativa TaxID=21020 RepID=UPI003F64EA30